MELSEKCDYKNHLSDSKDVLQNSASLPVTLIHVSPEGVSKKLLIKHLYLKIR